MSKLMSKVAMVTGATSGIGYATAVHLAASGYQTICVGEVKKEVAG